jgi:hypothetical protein
MDAKAWIELAMAVFTGLLAGATFWLAFLTRKLELAWLKAPSDQVGAWFKTSAEQIGVNTWLVLQRRFDSKEMRRARKTLAAQLKNYSMEAHDEISEMVPDFFEDAGTLYELGYLNKQLGGSSFGFYACRWWEAAKACIDHERKLHKEDETLFEDFESLAKSARLQGEAIDHEEVARFLDDEMKLD